MLINFLPLKKMRGGGGVLEAKLLHYWLIGEGGLNRGFPVITKSVLSASGRRSVGSPHILHVIQ